jgi:hypothetical protein
VSAKPWLRWHPLAWIERSTARESFSSAGSGALRLASLQHQASKDFIEGVKILGASAVHERLLAGAATLSF